MRTLLQIWGFPSVDGRTTDIWPACGFTRCRYMAWGIMDIHGHPCNDRAAPLAKEIGAKGLNSDARLAFVILFLLFSGI